MVEAQTVQTDTEYYDIVIVGGGMVGISLALLLAHQQHSWKILLLEAQAFHAADKFEYRPSFDARSTAVSWSSRKIFEASQLWDALQSHASPIHHIHVSDRGHLGLTRIDAAEAGVDALGYVIENSWMGRMLMERLAASDVEVVAPARVASMTPLKQGMSITLDDSERNIHAALVVIADGAQSQTAQKMGIQSNTQPYGQQGIIANIAVEKPHDGIAYERFTEQGPMAMLPLPDFEGSARCALVWTKPNEVAEQLMAATDEAFLQLLQDSFGYRLGQLKKVGTRHSYPLALTTASEQVRRNLVVLGNAAHSLHPVAGQGFNLSLRDVAVLAEVLGKARLQGVDFASLDVLQRYQARQLRDQQNTLLFSDGLPKLFAKASSTVAFGRNAGLLMMDLSPGLRTGFAQFGMGMVAKEAEHG